MKTVYLHSLDQTQTIAAAFAACCPKGTVVYLQGEMGAGKTTFSRAFLRGLGFEGAVKSPTYTLVEPYELPEVTVYHFDLYRLQHPSELIELAVEEYCVHDSICLIEWPERGGEFLPKPDITCQLQVQQDARVLNLTAHNTTFNEELL